MRSNHFFNSTKIFTEQLSEIFDFFWSTSAALWNMRWQVKGITITCPQMSNAELSGRFIAGSEIKAVNLRKSCIDSTWEDQRAQFAKLILSDIFSLFEAWAKDIQKEAEFEFEAHHLEVQDGIKHVNDLPNSPILESTIFPRLRSHKKYDYNNLKNLYICYRFFKQMRNSLIHRGGLPHKGLVDAYREFVTLTAKDLGTEELPEHEPIIEGKIFKLSLRGVAGFGEIALKIMVTIDAELARKNLSEKVLAHKWRKKLPVGLTIPAGDQKAQEFINKQIRKLEIPTPVDSLKLRSLLISLNLIKRI